MERYDESNGVTDGNNILVKITKYWAKVSHNPFRVQIADKPTPGYQVSPAHRDRGDGYGERDAVYIGRYECDSSYQSRTGQAPKVSTSLTSFRSGIAALGAGYWQADFALQLTWWYLYLVEFADWDGQAAIREGNCKSFVKINTGGTGLFCPKTIYALITTRRILRWVAKRVHISQIIASISKGNAPSAWAAPPMTVF